MKTKIKQALAVLAIAWCAFIVGYCAAGVKDSLIERREQAQWEAARDFKNRVVEVLESDGVQHQLYRDRIKYGCGQNCNGIIEVVDRDFLNAVKAALREIEREIEE